MVKNLPANAGDIREAGSSPGLGRSTGVGHDNPFPVFLPGESWWSLVDRGQRSPVGDSP